MNDSPTSEPGVRSDPASGAKPIRPGLGGRLRAYFFAGILITAPIGITVYLASSIVSWIDESVLPFVPTAYNPETYLPFSVPGIGLLLLLLLLTAIGAATAGIVGRMIVGFSERILNRMPVIRSVYGATKQILETVLAQKSTAFREVVLVEFPRRNMWALGFITGRAEGEVQDVSEEEMVNVYIPTTPIPTAGFLFFVARSEVYPLSMSVEEGIKMVVSGGIVTPPDRRPPEQRNPRPIPSRASGE